MVEFLAGVVVGLTLGAVYAVKNTAAVKNLETKVKSLETKVLTEIVKLRAKL